MLWTLRMSFMAIAFIFPILSTLAFTGSERDQYSYNISATVWGNDKKMLGDAMSSGVPALFVNVPVASSSKVSH